MPPRLLLRLEGLTLAAAGVVLYAERDYAWLLFVALILAPDLSFLGYLGGKRVGAIAYNLLHTLVGPLGLAAVSLAADWDTGIQLASIWAVHIGVDRLLGYGLKYPTAFEDTHLQRV